VDDALAEEAAATGRRGLVGSASLIIDKYGKGVLWRGIAPGDYIYYTYEVCTCVA
jgi:hypothetical protein